MFSIQKQIAGIFVGVHQIEPVFCNQFIFGYIFRFKKK